MIILPLIESRIASIVFSYILAFVSYNIVLYPVMSEKVRYELDIDFRIFSFLLEL